MKYPIFTVASLGLVLAIPAGCGGSANRDVAAEDTAERVAEPLSSSATVSELQPNIPWGGRAVAGTVSPSNAQVAFIAADTGGLFKTTNGGTSWVFAAGLPQVRMVDVLFDPRDATVVIATTHDDDHVASQAGIWRSTDAGATFAHFNLSVPNCPRYSGEGIAFAPDVDDLFVGIRCVSAQNDPGFLKGGIAVSHDKGASFAFVDLGQGLGSVVAQASGLVDVYGTGGHMRSTDRGASFGPLHTGAPGLDFGLTPNALAVSPLNSSVLFATTDAAVGGVRGARLFESDDAGATWRLLPFSQVTVSRQPTVSTRNVAGQVKLYFGNGFDEFRQTCTGTSPVGSCQGADLTRQVEQLLFDHADSMGVVFGSTGSCPLYGLADSGVLTTTDPNCLSWTTVPGGSTGFNALQVYDVADQVHPDHTDLYFGTQDNGLWASPDNGATWPHSTGPEGGLFSLLHSTPNDTDPSDFVTFNSVFQNVRMTPHMASFASWTDASPSSQSQMLAPLVVAPGVYLQWSAPQSNEKDLNITTDGSAHWNVIAGAQFFGGLTSKMWLSGPPANPIVFQPVIHNNGTLGLIKIVNVRSPTATVVAIDSSLVEVASWGEGFFAPIPVFGVDPNDPTHLIVADAGTSQMKVSHDGGATWAVDTALTSAVTVAGQLNFSTPPGELNRGGGSEARAISFNPGNGHQILVGTASAGVIASGDGGTTWFVVNGSTQIRNITAIAWDEVRHDAIVSTFGRGLFKITDNDLPPSVAINAGGPAVAPFVADVDFTGGSTINHPNTIDLSGVTNPAPMAVYQAARIGNFHYTIPSFAPGSSHSIRLHFAETFFSTAGSRVFNVSINGAAVLTKFDIFKTAGAKNKALIETFTENANTSGAYVIQFTSVVNNSLLSGLDIQ